MSKKTEITIRVGAKTSAMLNAANKFKGKCWRRIKREIRKSLEGKA